MSSGAEVSSAKCLVLPERPWAAMRRLGPFEDTWHAITALRRWATARWGLGNCTTFKRGRVAGGDEEAAHPRSANGGDVTCHTP